MNRLAIIALGALLVSACGDDGRGPTDSGSDAAGLVHTPMSCLPESIPEGGFISSEAYLETSSLQCDMRVCLVYQLDGVPFGTIGCETDAEAAANPDCATRDDTAARVYCSCRCDAPPESTAALCTCATGFTCVEVIDQPGAGLGLRGSYCVMDGTFTP